MPPASRLSARAKTFPPGSSTHASGSPSAVATNSATGSKSPAMSAPGTTNARVGRGRSTSNDTAWAAITSTLKKCVATAATATTP